MDSSENSGRPAKGERNDGEFESFLAEITPALETSVGRLGVAGALGSGFQTVDPDKLVLNWPTIVERVVEELH